MTDDEFKNAILSHLVNLTRGISALGLRDAATSMGAIEVLALEVKNQREAMADGLAEVAAAIREASRNEEPWL